MVFKLSLAWNSLNAICSSSVPFCSFQLLKKNLLTWLDLVWSMATFTKWISEKKIQSIFLTPYLPIIFNFVAHKCPVTLVDSWQILWVHYISDVRLFIKCNKALGVLLPLFPTALPTAVLESNKTHFQGVTMYLQWLQRTWHTVKFKPKSQINSHPYAYYYCCCDMGVSRFAVVTKLWEPFSRCSN